MGPIHHRSLLREGGSRFISGVDQIAGYTDGSGHRTIVAGEVVGVPIQIHIIGARGCGRDTGVDDGVGDTVQRQCKVPANGGWVVARNWLIKVDANGLAVRLHLKANELGRADSDGHIYSRVR